MRSSFLLPALLLLACGEVDRGSGNLPAATNLCGNGTLDPGEACDRANLNGASCGTLGLGPGGLSCRSDCKTFDRSQCGAPASCGNGHVDPAEVCEGAELIGTSCGTLGLGNGTLACLPNCNGYDSTGCSTPITPSARCGNGVVEGSEVCDGNNLGGTSCNALGFSGGTLSCAADCSARVTTGCTGTCTADCTGRACGPDPRCGTSCGSCTDGTCNSAGQCEPSSSMGAPRILSFNTNTMLYRGAGNLVFSAVLTDPDGVDDLIGGQLFASGGNAYGAFATQAQEGAYSLSLGWQDLQATEALNGPATGVVRAFRAQFFDTAGNMVSAQTNVTIRCNDDESSLCNGVCWDLNSDWRHCGQCNRSCDNVTPPPNFPGETDQRCQQGRCNYRLYEEPGPNGPASCAARCASYGATCNQAALDGFPSPLAGYVSYGCDEVRQLIGCNDTAPAVSPTTPECPATAQLCFCGL